MITNKLAVEARYQEIVKRLRGRNYRLTPQRQAILHALLDERRHPTLEAVYAQVRPRFPMTSISTVYKTVEMLKDLNEVLELEFAGGNRYDAFDPRDHPHLLCTRCQRIDEVALPGTDEITERAAAASGYADLRQRLVLSGLCPACQSQV